MRRGEEKEGKREKVEIPFGVTLKMIFNSEETKMVPLAVITISTKPSESGMLLKVVTVPA